MITCPHCTKGLLWGVYLDVPPEMKSGAAQWIACNAPEPEEAVTCPSCQSPAGIYRDLYAADADSRRDSRERERAQNLSRVTTAEHPSYTILAYEARGSYDRAAFYQKTWETLSAYLDQLSSDRVLPKILNEIPLEAPVAIGIRLDDSEAVSSKECRYLAGIVLPEERIAKVKAQLEKADFNDPTTIQIIQIPAGLWAEFAFADAESEFFSTHRFLMKNYLPESGFARDPSRPQIEIYTERLASWPPTPNTFQARVALPIEEAPAAAETLPSDEVAPEDFEEL